MQVLRTAQGGEERASVSKSLSKEGWRTIRRYSVAHNTKALSSMRDASLEVVSRMRHPLKWNDEYRKVTAIV